jgi:hypothetical protein
LKWRARPTRPSRMAPASPARPARPLYGHWLGWWDSSGLRFFVRNHVIKLPGCGPFAKELFDARGGSTFGGFELSSGPKCR